MIYFVFPVSGGLDYQFFSYERGSGPSILSYRHSETYALTLRIRRTGSS